MYTSHHVFFHVLTRWQNTSAITKPYLAPISTSMITQIPTQESWVFPYPEAFSFVKFSCLEKC